MTVRSLVSSKYGPPERGSATSAVMRVEVAAVEPAPASGHFRVSSDTGPCENAPVATTSTLADAGFRLCAVTARRLDIVHSEAPDAGPFCRLTLSGDVPDAPGVYAWAVDGRVCYVGMSARLVVVVRGATLGRANNDYTYVPPSKVLTPISTQGIRHNIEGVGRIRRTRSAASCRPTRG